MPDLEDISKAESFPLRDQENRSGSIGRISKNGDVSKSRLSFRQSVGQVSAGGSRTQINLIERQYIKHPSQLFQQAFPIPDSDRFVSLRPSFDLSASRQIIKILSFIGYFTGTAGFVIQTIAYINNTLNWRWSVGFWSGAVFLIHATVGILTLWKKLKTGHRTLITKGYLICCLLLAACCVAEMSLSVYTYNHASELINTTISEELYYIIEAEHVSIFNSLLAGCALVGILIGIFGICVSMQRLDIDLNLAQSFTRLASRRSSVITATNSQMSKSGKILPVGGDNSDDDDEDNV